MAKIYNYTQFVSEAIKASEAYSTYSSLKTLLDGKRKVAFETRNDLIDEEVQEILTQLYDMGFKKMPVKSNHGAVIIYHPDSYSQAEELKEIAERYGGYLHWQASLRDHRRIGELLEYEKVDIDNFIKKMLSRHEYENGLFKKTK